MLDVFAEFQKNPARGWVTTAALAHWKDLLEEWCNCHELYCRKVPDDPIYWYGERPNIGCLAAAAWLSKRWIALEEFDDEKIRTGSRAYGRIDLYLQRISDGCAEETEDFKEDYIESKLVWFHQGGKAKRIEVRSAQTAALRDARKIDIEPAPGSQRAGVVFVVPSLSARKPHRLNDVAKEVLTIGDKHGLDAAAWCFPRLEKPPRHHGAGYPGLFLLATLVEERGPGGER